MNTGQIYQETSELAIKVAHGRGTQADALGVCIAVWAAYRGDMIMQTFVAALEDANYHTEVAAIREMFPGFGLEEVKVG